ncbi:hypothetical protein QTP70_006800 [Hemibagrus guttatus]|uniref:VWFD domain-containing protein n=1 Tax=Hemibagrus guttatus TaxID=175788 RepID=A0AAE0PWU0_9TELE|nr:hypothetical protein QTP70_006800 [Hemibagrus guttatus]
MLAADPLSPVSKCTWAINQTRPPSSIAPWSSYDAHMPIVGAFGGAQGSECPCSFLGADYSPGDVILTSSDIHVCQHGLFQCDFHPCASMCTVYGDRHYRTFDGLLFDYIGDCKVYLIKSSADVTMSVTAENVDCFESGVICRKSLFISVGQSIIVFDDESGKPPPYSLVVDECTKLICVNGQLILFNKSQSCPYDSSPPNCGLLGFAVLVNGDKCCPKWDCPCRCSVFPDLNVVTFDGNSVALYKAAAYVVTQLMNETVTILVQECLISDSILVWNFTHLCLAALNITHDSKQVLVNRLQRRVPPVTFCEVWVRDAEYVNNPCVALAAYVASCHKFNICIEWRSQDYCPSYNNEVFYTGYAFISAACTDSFGSPRALGEVWKASVDGCCMYRCESDGIVPVEFECSDIPQPVCTRAGEISVSLADDNSCCTQRVCVCNQSACETTSVDCKFGQKMVSYFRQDSCCPQYTCECDPDQCVLDVPVCREDQTLIATRTEGSCCLAYICMCAICSEVIPECADGELLTVEPNSTDRCCPIYHCCK